MSIIKKIFGAVGTTDPSGQLKETIEGGAFLVDVRTEAEFAAGNVKGSINIPLDKLNRNLDQFNTRKSIVVFCRSGNRSGQARSILIQNGFTNVINGGSLQNIKNVVK